MAEDQTQGAAECRQIVVTRNGPYVVEGGIPLVSKTQIVSELGEPLTWKKEGAIPTRGDQYYLCRCGGSGNQPFCDGTHRKNSFNGTEKADTGSIASRQYEIPHGTGISVKKDPSLCMQSGFCALQDCTTEQLVASTDDTSIRALLMAMVERCPSGSLTYSIEPGGPEIEPDLPQQVAVTTEITSEGPIRGPLWVTGGIPVLRSDGQHFETRNRVTLCNCGHSCCKPLCDGTHRELSES